MKPIEEIIKDLEERWNKLLLEKTTFIKKLDKKSLLVNLYTKSFDHQLEILLKKIVILDELSK